MYRRFPNRRDDRVSQRKNKVHTYLKDLKHLMTSPSPTPDQPGTTLLKRSGLIWYLTAAAGQLAFVWMIIAHYGRKTMSGNYAGWNDKPIIKGYVEGDVAGNIMFAAHVLLAVVVTLGGLFQLVPTIRNRLPALHHWNGRLFLVTSFCTALGGLWMSVVRKTYFTALQAVPLAIDGVLILVFGAIAWRLAMARNIDAHRRWAMRTFMVVSGVWFLRVEIMGWAVLTHGWGLTETLSGPVDIALQFGCYLIPLAVLELYFLAQRSQKAAIKRMVSGLVLFWTAFMAIGIGGAVAFMWGPYML
jgi:hypothetical protein